jgi:hypothetical protein
MATDREQKIMDIAFSCLMMRHDKKYSKTFEKMTDEELAAWMARIYQECGFDNESMGSSWAVLKEQSS